MDIGAMDPPARIKLGLKPRVTGLPWVVWLIRKRADQEIVIELTETAEYDERSALVFLLEPTLIQLSGQPLDFNELEMLGAWVRSNMDLIEAYWEWTVPSGAEAVKRVIKAKPRW